MPDDAVWSRVPPVRFQVTSCVFADSFLNFPVLDFIMLIALLCSIWGFCFFCPKFNRFLSILFMLLKKKRVWLIIFGLFG